MSGLDWFPTLVGAAGDAGIVDELKEGKTLGGTTYKVHLDGYDQIDLITGKGPSKRHEVLYFAEGTLGAVRDRRLQVPVHRPARRLARRDGQARLADSIVNLRLDPFERTGLSGSLNYYNFFAHEFWRFTFVQQEVAKVGETFIEFPPMQKGASFNLEAVKEQILKAIQAQSVK